MSNRDHLKQRFDEYDADRILRLLEEHEGEDRLLEFKTAERSGVFKNREDKKNLAEGLSGFANAEGGLVVWGIGEEGRGDNRRLQPEYFDDAAAACRRIVDLTSEAISPAIDGVEHKAVSIEGKKGVVVTLVPPSDGGPHMARLGVDRYMRRHAASFQRMEHFELEEMFGRKPRAKLALSHRVIGKWDESLNFQGVIILTIHNSGKGIAKYPALKLRIQPSRHYLTKGMVLGRGHEPKLPKHALASFGPEWSLHAGSADHVIHAMSELEVRTFGFELLRHDTHSQPFECEYSLICEGCQEVSGKYHIPRESLREAARELLSQA